VRRLARTLFAFFWPVSLVLCVAVCTLWVRSYLREDHWSWTTDLDPSARSRETRHTVYVSRGTWRYVALDPSAGFPDQLGSVLLHDYARFNFTRAATGVQPFSVLAVLTGAPAFTATVVRLRRRQALPGPLPLLRLRPPREPRPLPGVRGGAAAPVTGIMPRDDPPGIVHPVPRSSGVRDDQVPWPMASVGASPAGVDGPGGDRHVQRLARRQQHVAVHAHPRELGDHPLLGCTSRITHTGKRGTGVRGGTVKRRGAGKNRYLKPTTRIVVSLTSPFPPID
jgi:hypothetical protein